MDRLKHFLLASLVCALGAQPVFSEPVRVPFDFSRSEIAINATIKGAPVFMFLDSGVDPSTIDLARAKSLHLAVGRDTGGEVSGTGSGERPQSFPVTIEGLAIAGHAFGHVDAIALDLGSISAKYERRIDGVLGFSFLADKAVLFDYPAHAVEILTSPADTNAATRSCHIKWSADLRLIPGENWPSFADFRFGAASAPVTLDTGSNSSLMLYRGALGLPGLKTALKHEGDSEAGGFRGTETRIKFALNEPIGFGPFTLPSGTSVTLNAHTGPGGVAANAGNKLFATLKLKMLLDYRAHRMAFFGECS